MAELRPIIVLANSMLLIGMAPTPSHAASGWFQLEDPAQLQLIPLGRDGRMAYAPIELPAAALQLQLAAIFGWADAPPALVRGYQDVRREMKAARSGLTLPRTGAMP